MPLNILCNKDNTRTRLFVTQYSHKKVINLRRGNIVDCVCIFTSSSLCLVALVT